MTSPARALGCGLSAGLLLAGGCAGVQSAVDPAADQAARIAALWWFLLVACALVFVAVVAALALALARRGRAVRPPDTLTDGEPRKVRVVTAAAGVTALVLLVFVGYSVFVARAMTREPSADERPVRLRIVGHQWWWQVTYLDDVASRQFTTANELYVPVGRPVVVELLSRDVIHSFWVPNLHGKMDVIPGRVTRTWFRAERAGEFRGQCAEFCGLQHAKMGFLVVAVPDGDFEAWAEASRRPAAPPEGDVAQRGAEVFASTSCIMCHTVRGTGAWGRVGPDLTRIGSRRTLAAAALPNTRGNLAAWILDPQHVKPGTFMPPTQLDADDLQALLAYLEGLR